MTRPVPAEGFQRLTVTVGGRKRAVDVPVLSRDELITQVRQQARQGTISFAERDRMVRAANETLNPDGTRRELDGQQETGRVRRGRARSTQRASRGSR